MRHLRLLLIFVAIVAVSSPLLAKEPSPQQFGIFVVSPDLFFTGTDAHEASLKACPLVPNPFTDYLPGKLYDIRKRLTPTGAQFEDGDFAWYNPHLSVLVVGAAPKDVVLVQTFVEGGIVDGVYNLLLRGEITIGGKRRAENVSSRKATWEVYGKSGQRTVCSAVNPRGIGYHMDIEATTGPNSAFYDCNMDLKVRYRGQNYALLTSSYFPFDKEQTELVGTTPDGQRIEFHLSTKAISLLPDSPLYTGKWKVGLLKELKSARQSARH